MAVKVSDVRKRGDHYYYKDKAYPAVTSILSVINKPALIPWAIRSTCEAIWSDPEGNNSYDKVYAAVMGQRDKGASRGSTVHSLTEALERGGDILVDELPEAIRGYGQAFRGFVEASKPRVLFTEANVYSDKYGYAGTCDLIAIFPDGLTYLADYKTGKDVYREAPLQVEAYRNADFILPKDGSGPLPLPKIDVTAVVLLKPDGTHTSAVVRGDFEAFLAAKRLWEGLKP